MRVDTFLTRTAAAEDYDRELAYGLALDGFPESWFTARGVLRRVDVCAPEQFARSLVTVELTVRRLSSGSHRSTTEGNTAVLI